VPAPWGTFGELLERWCEARSGDWSPSTAKQSRWIISSNLKGLSDRKVAALTVEDLDGFYAALRERGGRGGTPLAGDGGPHAHGREVGVEADGGVGVVPGQPGGTGEPRAVRHCRDTPAVYP
jgi:hypothetical protein